MNTFADRTAHDRAGSGKIASRIGISSDAELFADGDDLTK